MKLKFRIDYKTSWGQKVYICGSLKEFGGWNPQKALEMICNYPGEWELKLQLPPQKATLEYKYLIKSEESTETYEWGTNRKIEIDTGHFQEIYTRDFWHPSEDTDNILLSSAYTKVLLHPQKKDPPLKSIPAKRLRFQIKAPRVPRDRTLCILGNQEALGNWDEASPLIMNNHDFPLWKAEISANDLKFPIYYKYALFNKETNRIEAWEEGENRTIFEFFLGHHHSLMIQGDEKFRHQGNLWQGAGVAVPLFSLRSDSGFGVGEFLDLKKLVDWSVNAGLKLIQLLPITETVASHTYLDSYPYKSISAFALHPIYLNIDRLGKLKNSTTQKGYQEERRKLNELDYVDYEQVTKIKSRFYKEIYDQEGVTVLKSEPFKAWFDQNKKWLVPYAAFCYLRDKFKTPNYTKWEGFEEFTKEKTDQLTTPDKPWENPDTGIHLYLQYELHLQLTEVAEYARTQGVVLKGDIPIGLHRYSVDTWTHPRLFNLKQQAGTPPDFFSTEGQNWKFPTYNWENMANDDFSWWLSRMKKMAEYFDAYQIDHILEFFRIWEIPTSQHQALMGHFNPAIPISPEELQARGIWLDEERYCQPFIRDFMIEELFAPFQEEVQSKFLTEYEVGKFQLKKEFQTQSQVQKYFCKNNEENTLSPKDTRIRDGLFHLISEVLFLEDPYSFRQAFHPRTLLHDTYSYEALDEEIRHQIDSLYIDYFFQRHQDYWTAMAFKNLTALTKSSNMMICGEDLGFQYKSIPEVLKKMGILSLELQRMPKEDNVEFGLPSETPYLSVCSTSTHNSSTLRGWWEEDYHRTQRYYNEILHHEGKAPYFCEPWICYEIINQHLHSPSIWTIFPIQDLLAMDENLRKEKPHDERINIPSDPNHYWRYRLHLPTEQLLKEESFSKLLKRLIQRSGRLDD